ncbi:MAG TPA: helix-turn-helix transcriptional regulator [Desulfuromonadales bacterium]|nr:helix-turn-helix transcriptional regulator [Desulfuromonadales bacterium]
MDDLQQQTVGILLKNRRQELGLSLAEIASKTNIRRTYLEALEDDRYEALPGEAYQSGFLRNYAGALGLEAGSVLRQWRKATTKAGDGKRGEISVVSTQLSGVSPPRRLPRRRLFLLLPLLLVSAIALYFSVGSRQGAAVLQMPAPSTPALVQPAEQLVSPPPGENPLPVPASATEAAVAVAEQPAAPAAVALAAVPAIPAAGSVIRLEAMGPLEVEVAVDSRPLQRYVLSTASALQWNVGRSARLAVDNPAAVKIWLGGQPLDLAGRSEIVLQAAIPE